MESESVESTLYSFKCFKGGNLDLVKCPKHGLVIFCGEDSEYPIWTAL